MGLDFSKVGNETNVGVVENIDNTALVVANYDIVEDKKSFREMLKDSKEVDEIVSSIDLSDVNSLATFGQDVANGIAKAADVVLMDTNQNNDKTTAIMNTLEKVMKKIDIEEIKREPNFIDNIFGGVNHSLNKVMEKYGLMSDEVDKIYTNLKTCEAEIKDANVNLKKIFDANVNNYHEFVKYVLAGEVACEQIKERIEQRTKEMQEQGDNSIQFELSTLSQALSTLENRIHDLKIAENVAIQSIPLVNIQANTNLNLIRKMSSAFITTLPLFKQSLAQAILLKKQYLQTKMMKKLDDTTNELLLKNAQNTVELNKEGLSLVNTPSVKIETLETTWRTIVDGIDEVKRMQETANVKRQEDAKKLAEIKKQYADKFNLQK